MLVLQSFFANFPDFEHDASAPISGEFARLAHQRHWKKNSKTWKKQWKRCISNEYEIQLGRTLTGLQNWASLCEEMDLEGPFTSITQCKKALSKIHVNLVDLLDSRRQGNKVKKFPNTKALARYTRESGKVFGRDFAKEDGFLRVFLRKLV